MEEFRIFRYFPVVPSGTMVPYATRKRKRNKKLCERSVVSTSSTADLHTYFLRSSDIKFTFLLKRHQRAASTNDAIFRWHGRHSRSSCYSCHLQIDDDHRHGSSQFCRVGSVETSPQLRSGGASFAPCYCDGGKGMAVSDDEVNCVVVVVVTLMT